ncbi:hypothetical protein [Streptomyces sp. STR69]|uniref:hypothetical protein n=1 Tax=Streptomyces sp. STR69 TaxID=1796942 RepID=UPI0021C97D1F|nr:hypothetical protein [Streptomyces sp. STR69]
MKHGPVQVVDHGIADALQVIGVLLVFFFAYFSYAVSRYSELSEETGSDNDNLKAATDAYRACRRLLIWELPAAAALIALLTPLLADVFRQWSWSNPVRTGFILVYLSLIAVGGALVGMIIKAGRAIGRMNRKRT